MTVIANPYLDAVLAPPNDDEIAALRAAFGSTNDFFLTDSFFLDQLRRERLTSEYAWAIPTDHVIRSLAQRSPICDLGCGTGYWACMLEQAGARVIAVDSELPLAEGNPWHRAEGHLGTRAVIRHHAVIIEGHAETFDVPADHTLMLCWPPYNTPMAAVALARYQGNCVIYVGEGEGGCTGTDAFHAALAAGWELIERFDIPQWRSIHDDVRVYTRNP